MQAVNVLDAEIDRLDMVVKRFLDFSRPMDVRLEPTQLADLLKEVLEVAGPQLERAESTSGATFAHRRAGSIWWTARC